jgi:hypothetical protein
MARSRFCRICREFHDTAEAWPQACAGHFGPVTASGPQIISDTIEPFRHMGTGEIYSSKSRYRQDLRAQGYIECGNDRQSAERKAPPPVRGTLRDTYRQLGG